MHVSNETFAVKVILLVIFLTCSLTCAQHVTILIYTFHQSFPCFVDDRTVLASRQPSFPIA